MKTSAAYACSPRSSQFPSPAEPNDLAATGAAAVLLRLSVTLFLLRGIMLCSAMPSLEGWDEYQHLAYIQFLAEHGRAPVLGRDVVAPKLAETIRGTPQPPLAVEQFGPRVAITYADYWSGRKPAGKLRPLGLYQSQHPPAYYMAMVPVLKAFGTKNLPRLVTVLRLINLAMLAVQRWFWLCSGASIVLRCVLGNGIVSAAGYTANVSFRRPARRQPCCRNTAFYGRAIPCAARSSVRALARRWP